jgi:hypothetical protein
MNLNTSSTSTSSIISTTTATGNTGYTEIYTVIDAASTAFHEYVESSHEAVQILHQAYVCSFAYVLLLVGDSSGNIIRGMYHHPSLELYCNCFTTIYLFVFSTFHTTHRSMGIL